jgi:hypothetical protein
MPKRIFGPKRKLHNEMFRNLYCSLNTPIISIIIGRRIKWAGHVAHMGANYLLKALEERAHFEDTVIDGIIT